MHNWKEQRCDRCNGSGRVFGSGRAECPWNTFQEESPHVALEKILGIRPFRECPDCQGARTRKAVA